MNNSPERLASMFGDLPKPLALKLAERAAIMQARSGRTLVSLGSRSNAVYIVVQGRVQVTLYSVGGREVILRDLAEGEMFGELAAIDGQPRSATVIALTDCQLVSVDAETFRAAVSTIPEASLWLARRMTAQIRDLTARVFELNALTVRSRLHCELFRMCGGASATIEPSPTHAELASRVGTHREAVTRELGYLSHRGIIDQHRRRITVVDVVALAQLVRTATGEEAMGFE